MSESIRRGSRASPYRQPERQNYTPSSAAYRDTSVNIANAFSTARPLTFTPGSKRSVLSPHRSQLLQGDRDPAQYDDDVDDGEWITNDRSHDERAMADVFGGGVALGGDSLSGFDEEDEDEDEEGDENMYAEEEMLVHDHKEEERRRLLNHQRTVSGLHDSDVDDGYASGGAADHRQIDDMGSLGSSADSDVRDLRSPTKRVFDKALELLMFCFFMCFWIVKEITVKIIECFLTIATVLTKPVYTVFRWAGYDTQPLNVFTSLVAWLVAAMITLYLTLFLGAVRSTPGALALHHVPVYHSHVLDTVRSWVTPDRSINELVDRLQSLEKSLTMLTDRVDLGPPSPSDSESTIPSSQEVPPGVQDTSADSSLVDRLRQIESALAAVHERVNHLHHAKPQPGTIETEQLEKLLWRLVHDNLTQPGEPLSWQGWLVRYQDAMDNYITNHISRILENLSQRGLVVSREAVARLVSQELNDSQLLQQTQLEPDATKAVSALIDSALDRYHQDVLGLPDFASVLRGARVIPHLTSDSFTRTPKNWVARLLASSFGVGVPKVSPVAALMASTRVGECWPMRGSEGTLGVLLSEPVAIQSVTIEHPGRDVLADLRSAPKTVEIWGLKRAPTSPLDTPKFRAGDDTVVHLATVEYNIRHSKSIQTFDLVSHRYLVFEAVIFRVLSNWGSDDYTCLYRVRVHGIPAAHPDRIMSPTTILAPSST